MPIVQIHMLEGRSQGTKEQLIQSVTETISNVLKVKPESVRIIIEEMKDEHFAVGGRSVKRRKSEGTW